MPNDQLTETAFRIKRADGLYLMALTPKTDQPVWVTGTLFAWTAVGDDEAAAMHSKLRGRGLNVRLETFSRAVQPNPTQPDLGGDSHERATHSD